MYFDELAAAGRVSHCSIEAISDYGWGYSHFVLMLMWRHSTAIRQYLKNDTIVFRLPKIVVQVANSLLSLLFFNLTVYRSSTTTQIYCLL